MLRRSDPVDAAEKKKVANPGSERVSLGGVVNCFVHLLHLLGGPVLKKGEEDDSTWEIPFDLLKGLDCVGAGAHGVVFSAVLNGELVAVKKVREKGEADVKHLRKLNHDNIVRFRGISGDGVHDWVVMEFCQYGSLYDYLHSGSNLLPDQIMKWARDVALGMAYLHSHNIIHRDLKSPNILISDDLTAKVSDFGTSREWKNVSTTMSFNGTVAWMAPEVIRHEPCSEKVDVWAFGVVLWELFTREIPYKSLESHAVMWGIGTDTLSLPIPTGCPNTIQVMMCQCWQRISKNRPPFKILVAHLDMATPDIVATNAKIFAARQNAWGEEVRQSMAKMFTMNNKPAHSEAPSDSELEAIKPRAIFRSIKEAYEQQINRANDIYLEACTVRLQLEERERALAEREKQLKSCRCGQRNNIKLHRQQSSTSSDGKPIMTKQPRKKKPAQQLMVNYIDKRDALTRTIAVDKCVCIDDSIRNNNLDAHEVKKDTVVEQNGNVETKVLRQEKPEFNSTIPDVAQV